MHLIDFIIPTFDRKKELISMLASLNAQTEDNWVATVVSDGNKNQETERIIKLFDNPRIVHKGIDRRYNDWGHTPREAGKQMSEADYIIMTGDDNYYIPTLVHELNKIIYIEDPDFIYWDMVHSHYDYHFFSCFPRINQIDMGAFAFKAKYGKQIKLKSTYAADGEFVNEFGYTFPNLKYIKIEKVLFVHN